MKFLSRCPSLIVLSLERHRQRNPSGFCTADQLLRGFVEERTYWKGVLCPRLQHFSLYGEVDFSLETLRIFLEGKQGDITALNAIQWRKVSIDISGIKSAGKRQQISDLVSQKKAAGLDVHLFSSSHAQQQRSEYS